VAATCPLRASALAAACLLVAACARSTGAPHPPVSPEAVAGAPGPRAPAAPPGGGAWACTAAVFHACSFAADPGWDEYNNPWRKPPMPPNSYILHANSHSDWEVVAKQGACPTSDCAVEAYASAQYRYDNRPGEETIASITEMTSTFAQSMPSGSLGSNGFDAEAAYDIWLNNYALEVMIWVDNQGQTPAGGRIGTATLAGAAFTVYRSGHTYSFVSGRNEASGSVNILDALDWLVSEHDASSSSYLTQFNFGWEICSTGGHTDTFSVRGLGLAQSFR
jgi:hypothetical protein